MRSIKVKLAGLICFCLSAFSFLPQQAKAQSYEIQQLLLDVEKLSQFKSILSDMRQGYSILSQGYGAVKNIAQGNFSLHEVFLDGLMAVNPNIKKYQRVADIISDESSILSEYKSAYKRFKSGGSFSVKELDYMGSAYSNITSQALRNLNDLITVITASNLRMSDDERLHEIDRIYADTSDKLSFLRHFNNQASLLQLQRQKQRNETKTLQNLYGHEN
ncbi:TerB family tellurite resistance protein [Mucilaginibacter sp. L3T2-6]|uniref:TerB family tellurite resistance protein n=1 Tax=Mucilaginibacter sp. L3T2-6 TaxID=3062491 RepID=UPI002674B83C|nr:TerB family tellurite resistance protein [Mucilaginibacter sp. L3T2-6]MDO3641517.1 TerB family tellurite resistance protein [Mucilaginibacter sp. L3T2-6]MDV6213722.1 TerB family tellurite resistance protein [Mucilaginibacter sp. L3T2-6]